MRSNVHARARALAVRGVRVRTYVRTCARPRMRAWDCRSAKMDTAPPVPAVPHTGGCAQATAEGEPPPVVHVPSTPDNRPRSMERDFIFVERPSQDFFCPVSLELLLEPQLTSCCGHHLSLEAATRLQREGKVCPMCNGEQWSAMLDKYHRRRVHEVRVRCWYKDNGCAWVGEVNDLKCHADACEKRPWECQYCALKCLYGEGVEKHWPACLKFPEPCPNRCEVGSVERCNMEQHRSVCPLEPVACEMKAFGCSVVIPRKELATHMRESELQHLTAMTVLNLCLSRQLQQDMTELTRELTELKGQVQKVQHTTDHIEQHIAGEACSGCGVFTFTQYSKNKGSSGWVYSDPFYSHHHGYKLKLGIWYLGSFLETHLRLLEGEYDSQLHWPMEVKVHLELLNQAGDHHHVVKTENWKTQRSTKTLLLLLLQRPYCELEKKGDGVSYVGNDCVKFRIQVTVL